MIQFEALRLEFLTLVICKGSEDFRYIKSIINSSIGYINESIYILARPNRETWDREPALDREAKATLVYIFPEHEVDRPIIEKVLALAVGPQTKIVEMYDEKEG